jgi:hypothetical protein
MGSRARLTMTEVMLQDCCRVGLSQQVEVFVDMRMVKMDQMGIVAACSPLLEEVPNGSSFSLGY